MNTSKEKAREFLYFWDRMVTNFNLCYRLGASDYDMEAYHASFDRFVAVAHAAYPVNSLGTFWNDAGLVARGF